MPLGRRCVRFTRLAYRHKALSNFQKFTVCIDSAIRDQRKATSSYLIAYSYNARCPFPKFQNPIGHCSEKAKTLNTVKDLTREKQQNFRVALNQCGCTQSMRTGALVDPGRMQTFGYLEVQRVNNNRNFEVLLACISFHWCNTSTKIWPLKIIRPKLPFQEMVENIGMMLKSHDWTQHCMSATEGKPLGKGDIRNENGGADCLMLQRIVQ